MAMIDAKLMAQVFRTAAKGYHSSGNVDLQGRAFSVGYSGTDQGAARTTAAVMNAIAEVFEKVAAEEATKPAAKKPINKKK